MAYSEQFLPARRPWDDKHLGMSRTHVRPDYTLNQVEMALAFDGDKTVDVRLCNNTWEFDCYLVRFDDKGDWRKVQSGFAWPLKPGANQIEVKARNRFGRDGRAARAAVRYTPLARSQSRGAWRAG